MKNLLTGAIASLVLPALILSGCRSAEVSPSWREAWTPEASDTTTPGEDPTWREISATEFPAGDLALADLAGMALDNNPATRAAWHSARAAAAQVTATRGAWYPQLSVSGSGSYQKQEYSLKEAVVDPGSDAFLYGPAAELSWLLLDLGGRSARIEQALQELVAANFSFNQAIQDLLLQLETAYFDYVAAQAGLEAAQADLSDAQASLDAARDRVQAGLASKLDELQAEANYYDAQYSLKDAAGTLKSAAGILAQVVGLNPTVDLKIAAPTAEPPTSFPVQDVETMITAAISERPDVSALRSRVLAAEASLDAADSDLWPTLGVTGQAQQNWYSYNSDPELYDDVWGVSGFLTLSWDIFSGFSDLGVRDAAEADLAAARESLRQTELAAGTEVWNSYYDYETAVDKLQAARSYFSASQSSYALALDSYQEGLQSLLDLLQAQSDLSAARSKLVASRRDVYVALATLSHAAGRLGIESLQALPSGGSDSESTQKKEN